MKKRRLFASLMAAAMCLALLAGCGSGNEGAASSTNTQGDSDSGISMTMIIASRDEFMSTLEQACKDAADELGVKITTQDAQFDTSKMLQYIESARNNGDDAVIVNIVDPGTAQQCIDAAGDMKVVFVNRSLDEDVYSKFSEDVCGVWSDEDTSGYYQGEFLADYFKEKGQTDVKYIMVCGTLGQVYTTKRTEGAIKALKDNGINPIAATSDLVADYDRATAQDTVSPLINTIDYDCVICNNDAMALGVIEAMKSKGVDPTEIPVVGIDATVDGCEAVKNVEMAMTVFQNPVGQGYGAVMAAINMITGKPINEGTEFETDESGRLVWVPFEPVYLDNVDEYM